MAGDGELRIPVEAVRRHAGAVDTAADGMDTGRSAAAQVQMGADAYGKICSFLPGLINPLGDRVVTALAESASALRETAINIRSAAGAAESTDRSSSARLNAATRRIELPL